MNRIYPHQGQNIIQIRIEVVFDNKINRIVKKAARFFQVFFHFLFEIRFNPIELGSQFIKVFVQMKNPGIIAVMNRVQRVETVIFKRELNTAIARKFFKFVRHAEEAGPSIERKTVFFYLV